ncbi:DSBA family oxidoreductase [Blastomyces gilchristii SLH14081]|uniref:Glutathione S-transferase kappa n=1 Tax=Blastomyces gilchristii (strain SLH14081) TaxID=559298 RepID=A0A179UK16_BLAGS|nr:DSBA family oxidoreductase [Blastomyces gilchristii SLH14081]EQL36723.1 hypothetical protein BDFG_01693 [Blastomyces dermatitidis ATCC 26199]OAT08334.1 DSBA family oxidoreductase [Blastomyces gilchristii SLH14081]
MGGKIEAYFDCSSLYSYFAFLHLLRNREVLESYGIEIDIFPVFLGGINAGSGNTPPWTNPVKAKYSKYDGKRAANYFKVKPIVPPPFFPPLTILPQRVATYIKANYPRDRFEKTFLLYWTYMFYRQIDLSKPENVIALLHEEKYSDAQIEAIMKAAQSPEGKQALTDRTKEALDRGAFGAPWYWVTNAEGKAEPFFGSDRFHFMWQFLGVPFRDVEIVGKGAKL